MANLLLIAQEGKRHYAMIKNLSQLLTSSNSNGTRREHFCPASLRDKHFEYCIDSEAVRTDMPKQNSFMRFHSEQYQFRVPFIIYTDCGAILQSLKDETELNLEAPYSREINCHVPSGFCTYATFAYGEVEDPLRLCQGKDCMEVFCNHIEEEAKRLYHMFPQMLMELLMLK